MHLQPTIKTLTERKLVGKRLRMSFSNNGTRELWQSFMPGRREIKNQAGSELYSIEVYQDTLFIENFDPRQEFEKWAAIPVTDFDSVPEGMETITIPEGLYAVFLYKGKGSEASPTYQYIYGNWIPNSDYTLDHRPHLAIMGDKYKNEDPDSEEELWIPIKKKRK